jgi:hypothetical protein
MALMQKKSSLRPVQLSFGFGTRRKSGGARSGKIGCMAICGIQATMYCASGRLPFDNGGRVFFMKREGKPRLTESNVACRCSAWGWEKKATFTIDNIYLLIFKSPLDLTPCRY